MKNIFLFFAVIFCTSSFAQNDIVIGDMNDDGQLSIGDVSLLTDAIVKNETPKVHKCTANFFDTANEEIIGTWNSGSHTITLNEDGTAECSEHPTVRYFEFYPYSMNLILMNSDDNIVCDYEIIRFIDGCFTIRMADGTKKIYFSDIYTPRVEHEYIDLELPSGTLWATCNIGAESPEKAGNYYAWGEIIAYGEGKNSFAESNYLHCTEIRTGTYSYKSLGSPFELEYDAAYNSWGPDWCTPTLAQMKELFNTKYTTISHEELNGVKVHKVTSKQNGNCIYLPNSGTMSGKTVNDSSWGYLWTSELYLGETAYGSCYKFTNSGAPSESAPKRYFGLNVRAVRR